MPVCVVFRTLSCFSQIANAAAAALISAATHCGYGGSLRELVAAHSDYVVDALCRQLRHLDVRRCVYVSASPLH
jgi:hypothetical protein